MPWTESYPFRRLSVNRAVFGVTRVWWQLDAAFNDVSPYTYQLQAGATGSPTAADWEDVGDPVVDTWLAEDVENAQAGATGKKLTTHYRVKLTTGSGPTYVSNPVGCFGEMTEPDWVKAREIVRKELLRLVQVAGLQGVLFKKYRSGAACPRCLDPLTKEITDSKCPYCGGTRFKIGYHPPLAMQCWDLTPQKINETRPGTQPPGTANENVRRARVIAFPDLAKEDVWADVHSGERWEVGAVTQLAVVRGVPIVLDVEINLLPASHYAYRLQIGNEPSTNPYADQPPSGTGCVFVTHDYGGADALSYQAADGCGIPGARIHAFTAADYVLGIEASWAVASTDTLGNGRWSSAMKLDPGEYVLVFEKVGAFGPDTATLTVAAPDAMVWATSRKRPKYHLSY